MGRRVVGSPGGHQRELSGPLFTFNGLVISVTTVVAQLTANHSCAKPPHSAGYNSSVQSTISLLLYHSDTVYSCITCTLVISRFKRSGDWNVYQCALIFSIGGIYIHLRITTPWWFEYNKSFSWTNLQVCWQLDHLLSFVSSKK